MSEKRGQTGKMFYDFPTHAVLEIKIKGAWYRVTSRDFRSFNGQRRMTFPKQAYYKDIIRTPMETVVYNGPVYLYETNTTTPYTGEEVIEKGDKWQEQRKSSHLRETNTPY